MQLTSDRQPKRGENIALWKIWTFMTKLDIKKIFLGYATRVEMQDLQVLQLDMKDFMPQLTMQYNTHTSLYSRNSHCSSPFWSGCKKRSGRSLVGFPSDQQSAIGMPRSTIFVQSMPQNMDGKIQKAAIVNAARILSTQVRNSKQWSQSMTAYYLN